MARTQLNSNNIRDTEVKRHDMNITEAGSAVITKVIAGTNISISSTGVDAGTGDVTINASGGGSLPSGNSGDTIRHNGTAWISNAFLFNDGSHIRIGDIIAGPTAKLTINADNSLANQELIRFRGSTDDIQSLIYFSAGGNATYWDVNSSGNGGALFILDSGQEVARFLNSGVVINNSNTNKDFRVRGAASTHLLYADTTNSRIGILTSSPQTELHIYRNDSIARPAFRIEQDDTGDASSQYFLTGGQQITIGIDNDDNDNFKISNTSTLTGTTYSDANTMMRVHTESGSIGIMDFNHQSRCRAMQTTVQSIANNTWVKVLVDNELYDEQSEFDIVNRRFTAKEEGYYLVVATLSLGSSNGSGAIAVGIYRNSVKVATGYGYKVGNRITGATVTDVIYVQAGQIIEIYGYQNTGAARNTSVVSGEESTLAIHKLS